MKQYVEKMVREKQDLEGKIARAEKVIATNPFDLNEMGRHLLEKQVQAMKVYCDILAQRIEYERVV